MALSDAEVQKQVKQMVAFIEQEANEKVEEIDAKAEEEFNIEKGRLVQQQRLKIMEFFERKEKQVEMQKKIQASNMLNQARLQVLRAMEDHVNRLYEDMRRRLVNVPATEYPQVLEMLVAQGLFVILEPNVLVRCREKDISIVKQALASASKQLKDATGRDVNVTIDEQRFLPVDSCGGVILTAHKDRILVKNTLEARLEMIFRQLLPEIRVALFGRNPNRKFDD
ncbi:unnamed protein product [Cyprideis torosa]|uniref:Uncharacterized protein n=1 Tax=Cyprideis torosa TaxID=163714 RepID=A0A7R8WBE8_9CRUS|nr:unnamed protein product [Cyprideis torosa]CAG0886846.1 unnamed protein product [Cyprideis torosa]